MDQNLKDQIELLELLEAKENELQYNKLSVYYPDTGPYRRELYKKHLQFMKAGKNFSERAFVAANRTGKTLTGAFEMACHLTGLYPDWWEGRRFLNAIDAWAAGISNQSTKEIIQKELLGELTDLGSGMIPKDKISSMTKKPGVADAIETVKVMHTSGRLSTLTFKSYEQGWQVFQGTKKQVIWLDEEPDNPKIYSECITRLFDKFNPGIIYCTFTPLLGLSEVVMSFLPNGTFPKDGINEYKYVINVSWDEVPHISDEQKAKALSSYSRHERDARSKGIPSLGSGAIYPYSEDEITCEPFQIPLWWPRAFGLDTGWKKTAAIWGALDPESKTIYLYSEYYAAERHPAIHAHNIKTRGQWMIGAADPAGINPTDGQLIFDLYVEEGLNLVKADKKNSESGILQIGQLFEANRLKIFNTLENTLSEIRVYRRDEKGAIVKKNDHLMDAMRYLGTTGMDWFTKMPLGDEDDVVSSNSQVRDRFTGY